MAAVFAGFKSGIAVLGALILAASCSNGREDSLAISQNDDVQDPGLATRHDEAPDAPSEAHEEGAVSDDGLAHGEASEPAPAAATGENPRLEQAGLSSSLQQHGNLSYLPAELMNIFLSISEHMSRENFRTHVAVFASLAARWKRKLEDSFKEMVEFMEQENKIANATGGEASLHGESSQGLRSAGEQDRISAIAVVSKARTYLTRKIWEAFNELWRWLVFATGMGYDETENGPPDVMREYPVEDTLPSFADTRGAATTPSLPEWMRESGSGLNSGLVMPSLCVVSALIHLNNQCAACLVSLAGKMGQNQNAEGRVSSLEGGASAVASGGTVSEDEMGEIESLIGSFNQCSEALSECLRISGVSKPKLEQGEGDAKQQ